MADNEESGFNQRTMARRSGQVWWGANYATVAELKAVEFDLRRQLQMSFVLETQRMYYWDQNSTATGDDDTVVTPTDASGRWIGFGVLSSGSVIYNQTSQPPISQGRLWWDRTLKVMRMCDGNNWDTILGGSNV